MRLPWAATGRAGQGTGQRVGDRTAGSAGQRAGQGSGQGRTGQGSSLTRVGSSPQPSRCGLSGSQWITIHWISNWQRRKDGVKFGCNTGRLVIPAEG